MSWYLENGKENDVVVSSRIRYARNLKEFPFMSRITKAQAIQIKEMLKEAIKDNKYNLKFIELKDMDDITKLALVENHVISPEFAINKNEIGAIIINEDESICIMINEEDHLRIQVFSSGLNIEEVLKRAEEIDSFLASKLNFAFNKKHGFLTECPTNVGTGIRASVMVHLPALDATKNIRKVLNAVNGFGMNIRGLYGEGTDSQGNIYQISNKQTLGITEGEIVKNVKVITEKVIEQERLARKILSKNSIELEDKLLRSYGILSNCKKISSEESNILLSDIKLGVDLGIIPNLTDLKMNKLQVYTKPANLQKYEGKTFDSYERDVKRAEIIKKIISE